jgi:integrase/recombinase XerD
VAEHIPLARKADTLPAVLSRDQVVRFLKAVPDLEMRTIFITIYSAGLRVSEAVALTAHDIDSANMVIHVRQGKGRKDRYVMLSEQLLAILRAYWKCAHLQHLVFPGPGPDRPITVRSVQRACREGVRIAGLDPSVTTMLHLLTRFLKDETGATAIEYGLIAAGISVVIIAAVQGVGANLNATFTSVQNALK